jgi:hypothetical protein
VFAPLLAYRPTRGADEITVTASSAAAVAFEFVGPIDRSALAGGSETSGDWWLGTTKRHVTFESWCERDPWQYARRIVAERDTNGPAEDTIKAAVDDLLDRAALPPGTKRPKKTAKARRVAARTHAANAPRPATVSTTAEIPSPAAYLAPESDEPIADVIPLPVFDPDKEAESWW